MGPVRHHGCVADPERFGRYRVVRRIGSGAFASVWLARDEVLDGEVAVKVLADNWAGRVDVRERFLEEARMLRRADSDRVVRVHDIGELEDGRPYFVMTYADSGTVADRLTGVPMPAGQALWFAVETARGVAVLHDRGIIHRDIKPSNVLLRGSGDGDGDGVEVLVSDLGLAKAAAAASGLTLAAGTPGFMPPEQAEGFGLTFASDVYALGALTYRLLAGRTPRAASSPRTVIDRAGDAVPALAVERGDLPDGVDEVLARALRQDPAQRQADARVFERELLAVAGDLQVRPGVTVAGGSSLRQRHGAAGGRTTAARAATALVDGDRPTVVQPRRSGAVRAPAVPEVPEVPAVPAAPAVPAVPARARSRTGRRRGARVAAVVGLVLLVLVLGTLVAGLVQPDLRSRAVAAARGDAHVEQAGLAVELPRGWARQRSGTGAAVAGVPGTPQVLAVGEDVQALSDPGSTDRGVVIARWGGNVLGDLRSRLVPAGCTPAGTPPNDPVGGIVGATTELRCGTGGTGVTNFTGVRPGDGATTLLVQVRGGTAAQRREVLDSVRVTP